MYQVPKKLKSDFVYCPYCGKKQTATPRRASRNLNGSGSARKRGNTWSAVSPPVPYMDGNQLRYRRIERGGYRTKKEALLAAPTLMAPIRTDQSNITFSALYSAWLDRHKDRVTKSTLGCYTAAYKHYEPLYYAKFVDLVTADWQACVDDCSAGKRTRQNMKALGTLLYHYAQEQDITQKDFATHIYVGNLDQVSRNAFSREELATILQAAHAGNTAAAYIACGCYTGFRPSALFALRKSDYNPADCTLKGGIKTAAGRDRIVPISPKIMPLITAQLSTPGEWLFPSPKGGQCKTDDFRVDFFYPCLAELCIQPVPEKGDTPKYTPYSWRHTFFTLLARVPGESKLKAELGGHTSYQMSQHYQHPDLTDKRAIIDALD